MKKILIEGWRGINHSYAMVNQNQLIELNKSKFELYHNDLPFCSKEWGVKSNSPGFDEESELAINSIPPLPGGQLPDVTYRISFPYRFYKPLSGQLFVFGTSEYQQLNGLIFNNGLNDGLQNSTLKIITPSNWSKIGFINSGFEERRICVVPHGVADIYRPPSQDEVKDCRRNLGCSDEEFAILSMGSMTWNKGVDILILAYAILKIKYPHIRLILKDSSNLYGISAKDIFYQVKELNPNLLSDTIFQSIIFISENLTQAQLNSLYGSSDCYVSPYRAEGFNLSPLEAAASGTSILVTEGGSTDDYFDESLGAKIEGCLRPYSGGGHYIEPSLESLVHQLTIMIESRNMKFARSLSSALVRKNFSWASAVKQLEDILIA